VAERRQSGRAEHQVVAEREQHPDHDLERQVLVQADAGEPERRRREQSEDDQHRQGKEPGARRGGRHTGKHGHGQKECTF
jgi:hypothetical protein